MPIPDDCVPAVILGFPVLVHGGLEPGDMVPLDEPGPGGAMAIVGSTDVVSWTMRWLVDHKEDVLADEDLAMSAWDAERRRTFRCSAAA